MPENIVIALWSYDNRWERSLESRLLGIDVKLTTVNKWIRTAPRN